MRDLIRRLWLGNEQLKRFCTVERVLADGRYRVRDLKGESFEAESTTLWRRSEWVTVIDKRIVGPARRFINVKSYRV